YCSSHHYQRLRMHPLIVMENYNKPHFVKEVIFPDGKKKSFKPKEQRAMQDYTAYMVTDVLRDVVKPGSGGTGATAYVPGVDVAGKTGTQNFDEDVIKKYGIPADANSHSILRCISSEPAIPVC
ncbi:penicillin-binding transpeptidase domain-containing protein, partial [Bacillus sp. D-CC]